jgi:hypothetical protein
VPNFDVARIRSVRTSMNVHEKLHQSVSTPA